MRFLSETGGGRVAGFQGKNIVIVEDEDGFQIPTTVNDVVVVDDDDYSTSRLVRGKENSKQPNKPATPADNEQADDPADRPVTFKMPPIERGGGDKLSAYIAYVPIDPLQITTTRFETYIVNDCNYYLHCVYMTAEGANWTLRFSGEVEPNTKMYVEEFGMEDLNNMARIAVHIIAYKRDKTFLLKQPATLDMRLDLTKFYKLHTFADNVFFEQKAYLITIIENDKQPRHVEVDPNKLREVMTDKANEDAKSSSTHTKVTHKANNEPLVIDLHADKLLDTLQGMGSKDILDYQMDIVRKTLTENARKKGMKIIFIHGKGNGTLRKNICQELKYRFKTYTYHDASFQEYSYGATEVTIK